MNEVIVNILTKEAKKRGKNWRSLSSLELVQIYQEYKDKLPCENEFNFLLSVKKMQQEKIELWDKIPSSLEIIDMDEDTDFEWVVDKLIPKGGITLLYGRGGIGKTWLTLQMCKAIANGEPFCGLKTKKCPVMYVGFEDPLSVISKRLRILGASRDLKIWHIDSDFPPPHLDLSKWQIYQQLPSGSLIVIDTLRAAHSKDENSSQDIAKIMDRLKELRRKGITIVLLHHTPKASEGTYKGSTAILDLVDHELCLEKLKDEDEGVETEIYRLGTKQKTRFEPGEIFLSFNGEGFELAQDPKTEKYLELYGVIQEILESNEEPLQKNIVDKAHKRLGWSPKKIRSLLKQGKDIYWKEERIKGANKIHYLPLNYHFPLYIRGEKWEFTPKERGKYPNENQEKTLTSSEFSHFPEGSGKMVIYPKGDEDEFEYDL